MPFRPRQVHPTREPPALPSKALLRVVLSSFPHSSKRCETSSLMFETTTHCPLSPSLGFGLAGCQRVLAAMPSARNRRTTRARSPWDRDHPALCACRSAHCAYCPVHGASTVSRKELALTVRHDLWHVGRAA